MERNKRLRCGALAALAALAMVGASCATPAANPAAPGPAAEADVYAGTGQSDSLLKAINLAKMDAVRRLVQSEIGASAEQANQAKIKQAIYDSPNPNQYVYNESMQIGRKDNLGTVEQARYLVELRVKVRRAAVLASLDALGLAGRAANGRSEAAPAGATGPAPAPDKPALAPAAANPAEAATPEQRAFIQKYLDKLRYLVYFSDKTSEKDRFLLKAAVTQANAYLARNGYDAVDADQVEKLKKDKSLVYEEQTGGQMSMIQWIAQSLNADVYLEIDASTTSEAKDGRYYGQAIVTVKLYETSTGQLLGAQPYASPKTMSTVDQTDAVNNALQSSVWAVMPLAVGQSKQLLAKQFANGIHYELTLQKTADAKVLSALRSKLRRLPGMSDLGTRSQAADATVLDLYYYGRADDLSDAILGLAGTASGLDNLDLVLVRGKSLIFNAGF